VEVPQFEQKDVFGFNSAWQFEQYIFCCFNDCPQPVQNVSPSSYGVLQLAQRNCLGAAGGVGVGAGAGNAVGGTEETMTGEDGT
jgi:hypothetical protein